MRVRVPRRLGAAREATHQDLAITIQPAGARGFESSMAPAHTILALVAGRWPTAGATQPAQLHTTWTALP